MIGYRAPAGDVRAARPRDARYIANECDCIREMKHIASRITVEMVEMLQSNLVRAKKTSGAKRVSSRKCATAKTADNWETAC
jgi:hypothetical protein